MNAEGVEPTELEPVSPCLQGAAQPQLRAVDAHRTGDRVGHRVRHHRRRHNDLSPACRADPGRNGTSAAHSRHLICTHP